MELIGRCKILELFSSVNIYITFLLVISEWNTPYALGGICSLSNFNTGKTKLQIFPYAKGERMSFFSVGFDGMNLEVMISDKKSLKI